MGPRSAVAVSSSGAVSAVSRYLSAIIAPTPTTAPKTAITSALRRSEVPLPVGDGAWGCSMESHIFPELGAKHQ